MSVLIKGMKMPMGCYECPFEVWGKCMFINYNVSGTEPKSCPLVEVPFPHGRLIDADDAFIDADERGCDFWSCDADIDSAQEFLRAQPTIIEAEEGLDDNA